MVLKRRLTKQRKIILDRLKYSEKHLSADELYGKLKEDNPELSLGTVYRNLNVLCELGEIKRIEGDFPSSKYDGNILLHHHFYCSKCEEIYDVDTDYSKILQQELEKNTGHKVEEHSTLFTGVCKDCRKIIQTRDKNYPNPG